MSDPARVVIETWVVRPRYPRQISKRAAKRGVPPYYEGNIFASSEEAAEDLVAEYQTAGMPATMVWERRQIQEES